MNRKTYKFLCDNFNKEVNPELYEIWKEELIGYDDKLVEDAVRYIIQNDKFMPTLARIIEIIKQQPYLMITDEEKIKRWNKKNIYPTWMDKEIVREEISDEELAKLEEEFKIFER